MKRTFEINGDFTIFRCISGSNYAIPGESSKAKDFEERLYRWLTEGLKRVCKELFNEGPLRTKIQSGSDVCAPAQRGIADDPRLHLKKFSC